MISYMNKKHLRFTGEAQYSYYVDPKQCPTAKNKLCMVKINAIFVNVECGVQAKNFLGPTDIRNDTF